MRCMRAHLHGLGRINFQKVLGVVQWRLLVIEGWEPHALEVPPVALLPSHYDPAPPRHTYVNLAETFPARGYVLAGIGVMHNKVTVRMCCTNERNAFSEWSSAM